MQPSRILTLTDSKKTGNAVIYIMSRDQRVHDNHALLAAQNTAIEHDLPLYVFFNLKKLSHRSREHYEFMLAGLEEVAAELSKLTIPFIMRSGDPEANILALAKELEARYLYFDFNPLTGPRNMAKKIAASFDGTVCVVDTHNIIPAWVVSDKKEFAAHTMRTKIHKYLETYLIEPPKLLSHHATPSQPASLSFNEARSFISTIPACGITVSVQPGEKAAHHHLKTFLQSGLEHYAKNRNDIANDQQSGFSPYLHYGHISSLRIALEVFVSVKEQPLLFQESKLAQAGETPSRRDGMNALFEEMIVRKELADNFCFYADDYLSLSAGLSWAQTSIAEHALDKREFLYSRKQWENAQTHDQSWNAAQNQLRKTGKMHGYMRMYWAKKMLEWSKTPDQALADCIYLNDKYSIDGGDPNGYVGILWSMIGLHDRPWFERPVFGKIRYMNEGGLMRKYDVASYQQQWL